MSRKKINSTTYSFPKRSKDFLTYVGGLMEEDQTHPEFEIQRFKSEVRLKFRLDTSNLPGRINVSELENEIRFIGNGWYVTFGETDSKTGFDADIILERNIGINEFSWLLSGHEDLNFFFQPPLTDSEKESGEVKRPERVENSWAIYHSQKNDTKKYGAGKVGHLYRREAIDSLGNKVWCETSLDPIEGKWIWRVPPSFLESASYPVIIGHETFGYTTQGASLSGFANRYMGSHFTMPEDGYVSHLHLNGVSSVSIKLFGLAIYEHVSNTDVGNLIAYSSEGSINTTQQWHDQRITSPANVIFLEAGEYWLVCWGNSGGGSEEIAFDTGSTNDGFETSNDRSYNYPSFEDPINPEGTNQARLYSLYASYTPTYDRVSLLPGYGYVKFSANNTFLVPNYGYLSRNIVQEGEEPPVVVIVPVNYQMLI